MLGRGQNLKTTVVVQVRDRVTPLAGIVLPDRRQGQKQSLQKRIDLVSGFGSGGGSLYRELLVSGGRVGLLALGLFRGLGVHAACRQGEKHYQGQQKTKN